MKKYQMIIPDLEFYRSEIECQHACPVVTDARAYVTLIAKGDYENAYMVTRNSNPFASICGLVCAAPCEEACRRGKLDAPIAIRPLKRFVTEKYGVESPQPREEPGRGGSPSKELRPLEKIMRGLFEGSTMVASDIRNLKSLVGSVGVPEEAGVAVGGKVAIIGSGCAGLTAAHDLIILGHRVTVFEMENVPGGMLVTGVPLFRMDRRAPMAEIQAILNMGVDLRLNAVLGRDFTIDDLFNEGYRAVLITIGLCKGRRIPVAGMDASGVIIGVEYLREFNLGGKPQIGNRVLVIGGGDVAMDCARISLRLGAEDVHIACLESLDEMRASAFEVQEALEEGIRLHPRWGPKEVLVEDGKVAGLRMVQVVSVFDEAGRFSPKFNEEVTREFALDNVVLAVGQMGDLAFLGKDAQIQAGPGATIKADMNTLMTDRKGVFVAGDIALGAKLFIDATANGQKAALAIHQYLTGKKLVVTKQGTSTVIEPYEMIEDYIRLHRTYVPSLESEYRRTRTDVIEQGYAEPMAVDQGARCLMCSTNVVFDQALCILCNGCVDICPEKCLYMVRLDQMEGQEQLYELVKVRYAEVREGQPPLSSYEGGTAMIMDYYRCIRCGLCARRCPTQAITMEEFSFRETLQYAEDK